MKPIANTFSLPVIGFAAFSGSGKTTLLKKLIPLLRARKLRVGMIKQSHHDIEIDEPGKDSYELRKAGASQTLLASPLRTLVIHEHQQAVETDLQSCIAQLDSSVLDIVLVEGFKQASFTKLEIQRMGLEKPLLYPADQNIIAIITDDVGAEHSIPVLDLNSPEDICHYICQHVLSIDP
jgi:molybdopterin-guanine dinucleotide biosynthesis protein MobB